MKTQHFKILVSVASEGNRLKKRSNEIEFKAYDNPRNHMSSHNWKFDYRTTPWEQLMNRTMGTLEGVQDGHYRKPSETRKKQERETRLELIDQVISETSNRYPSKQHISQIIHLLNFLN